MELGTAICIGAVVVSMIFIMIGHIFKDQIQSVLKTELFSLDKVVFDYWSLSHLLLYMVFGFFKPGYATTFFLLGVGFELFEDFLSSDKNTQLVKCPNNGIMGKIMCNGIQDGYWYGKADDIAFNLIGYVFGNSLRTTFFKNII